MKTCLLSLTKDKMSELSNHTNKICKYEQIFLQGNKIFADCE